MVEGRNQLNKSPDFNDIPPRPQPTTAYQGVAGMIPTAASFSPAHPLARRDVPVALARAFRFRMPFLEGVAETALYCAHRTSTVSPCAFCEQGGHLAAPYPSFSCRVLREQGDRPSYPALFFSILLVRWRKHRYDA
jgi:hypothetical protein